MTARAPGSLSRQPPPAPLDLSNCPIAEHAVISALQAVAVNPHYSDFMRSMERLWPELRQVTLPTVTIQNDNASNIQPVITIPHVNPSPEQPGHSRTLTIERSRSPSRSSSSSQKVVESATLPQEKETSAHQQG